MNNNVLNLRDNLFATIGLNTPEKSKKVIAGYLHMIEEKESKRFVQLTSVAEGNEKYRNYNGQADVLTAKESLISAIKKLFPKNEKFDPKEIKLTIFEQN